jgi:uncharacterized repeat protein (TIGR01451 family)
VTQLANSATIADGGGTSATGSHTTPVSASPALSLAKSDGGASTTPGGTVIYTLSYQNTGNVDLSAVYITEIVPSNTTFSATGSSAGWSCASGSSAGTSCTFGIGALAGGASGSVAFAVTVDNPVANGATQIDNQADIDDDLSSASDTASDSTPVTAAPLLSAQKTVVDMNGGAAQPGDLLQYSIAIRNTGNTAATKTTFADAIPANTTYVPSSTTLNGTPLADVAGAMPYASGGPVNTPGEPGGQVNAGEIATVVFRVTINNPLPAGVTQVSNQGTAAASGVSGVPTDDPGTPAAGDPTTIPISNPTAITLASFTATPAADRVVVRWVTTAERNTWGFHLYRSADGTRAHAVRVTPQIILGRGRDGGASYQWVDMGAAANVTYSYWLQEIEIDGTANEYGPARAAIKPTGGVYRVFVPMAVR